MAISPDELKEDKKDISSRDKEAADVWEQCIDRFLKSGKFRRSHQGHISFTCTDVSHAEGRRLPRVTWGVSEELERRYTEAGWDAGFGQGHFTLATK